MASSTGYWDDKEALEQHDFSYELARWIGEYLPKGEPIIDMGCGRGAYLRYLHDIGFTTLFGLEGEVYPFNYFGNVEQQDLSILFDKNPKGNTLFLEVGEHIPIEFENIVLDNVCNNTAGKLIISWAIPNQGGYLHVNCKHNIWVIEEIEKRGFKVLLKESMEARSRVEERVSYFRNTILIFQRNG